MTRLLGAVLLFALAGCATAPATRSGADSGADSAVLIASANTELQGNRPDAADELFARALKRDPANNDAKLGLAESALRAGRAEQARDRYAVLEGVKDYADRAYRGKAAAEFALGDADGALATLRAAAAEAPSADTWLALAHLEDARHDWPEANTAYAEAIRIAPTARAFNDYGVSLLDQQRYDEAQTAFLHALEADPALAESQNNLRLAYAWQGRYDAALVDVLPNERPEVLNNLGYIAMKRGDVARAKLLLMEALRSSPTFYKKAADNLQALQGTTVAKAP